jgi:hypothetical protein
MFPGMPFEFGDRSAWFGMELTHARCRDAVRIGRASGFAYTKSIDWLRMSGKNRNKYRNKSQNKSQNNNRNKGRN